MCRRCGIYDTAPYGRQGQWRTLEEMVAFAAQFTGAELPAEDLKALTAFVRQIPGDALYLNSARPLNQSDHVWNETPVELTFSQVLSPGQADGFVIERLADEGAAELVAGSWSTSGRVARFEGEAPLELETDYRITITAGLTASLGQTLYLDTIVEFTTGAVPELDVYGSWLATALLEGSPVGALIGDVGNPSAIMSFLQSAGGNLTGVLQSEIDGATLDHVEGVTSATTVVLEPFLFGTPFGDIMVDTADFEMVDEDGDGWAESGVGKVSAIGFTIDMTMKRVSYPDGVDILVP